MAERMIARSSIPPVDLRSLALDARVAEAVADIRERYADTPEVGLILGTGLGELADEIEADAIIPYGEIRHFPRSTAVAHKGQLVCGRLAGAPVVAMQGRCHLYEGHKVADVTLPVRAMHGLGIRTLIVSNAAGGMNPKFKTGDLMLIDDHINLMFAVADQPAGTAQAGRIPRPAPRLYDLELIEQASAIARRANFVAHRGVYVGVTGPTYETRAEYRTFRRNGGDCVGMSTVPEVYAAAACGLRVLGISTITNVAKPDVQSIVSSDDVVNVAHQVQPKLRAIVLGLLGALTSE